MNNVFVAFVPWILFSVVAQRDDVAVAGMVALVAALVIAIPSFAKGRPKILDVGAIVAFGAFAVVGLVDGNDVEWLSDFARGISAALLAVIALGSLLWVPFTEQYAREQTPEAAWSSPTFKRVNRELTLMWGLVFAAMVPFHVLAGAIDTQRADTFLNWVIPIALIVWAVKRTERLSAAAGDEADDHDTTTTTPAGSPA
jgi:hypothetical protein